MEISKFTIIQLHHVLTLKAGYTVEIAIDAVMIGCLISLGEHPFFAVACKHIVDARHVGVDIEVDVLARSEVGTTAKEEIIITPNAHISGSGNGNWALPSESGLVA